MSTLFTRIIRRELPAQILLETEHEIAFLDLYPESEGHALVVPRRETARLEVLPPEEAHSLFAAVLRLVPAILRASGAPDYNLMLNNGPAAKQEVPHVHMHIIPRFPGGSCAKPSAPASPDALAQIAERIRNAL